MCRHSTGLWGENENTRSLIALLQLTSLEGQGRGLRSVGSISQACPGLGKVRKVLLYSSHLSFYLYYSLSCDKQIQAVLEYVGTLESTRKLAASLRASESSGLLKLGACGRGPLTQLE